jgi:hypothetical protein
MKHKIMTLDRLGEGSYYELDILSGAITQNRSFSDYDLRDICEHTPSRNPATLKNPDDRSDFTPAVAVTNGYCPGQGRIIIRATRTGQIEYDIIGS